ncbi:MAG TPA: metallopeptidase family protein [Stellaceae bacterium]|nr:metallopeptidase family protein [Stellaceae bacterium]
MNRAGDEVKRVEDGEPGRADVEELARQAFARLPERFKRHLGSVVIRVEDFPDRDTQAALRLASPFDLLGLYRGVALPYKSVSDPYPDIDMIFLYRQPILAYCRAVGEDLARVVRHVLIHEIGHHFGFSDHDMARIESGDRG